MSNEKNIKKEESGLSDESKQMERRSFLKKIGLAGGAVLAHFFVLGKPSTAFGDRPDNIEAQPIELRLRCRPRVNRDKGDFCYIKDGRREVSDHCFIRRTAQGMKEVGDKCVVVNGNEVGDQCTIVVQRNGAEKEVGDQCGGQTAPSYPADDLGDQCFISHQSFQNNLESDFCTIKDSQEVGDRCSIIHKKQGDPVEVGDNCAVGPNGNEIGDECFTDPKNQVGDKCRTGVDGTREEDVCNPTAAPDVCIINSAGNEIGDKCLPPDDPDECVITPNGKEIGDECIQTDDTDECIVVSNGNEVGDKCFVDKNGNEVGDECSTVPGTTQEVGDECFFVPIGGVINEIGDECNPPGDPNADIAPRPAN